MSRRGFLKLLGAGVVGGVGVLGVQNGGDVSATVDDVGGLAGGGTNESGGSGEGEMVQSFGFGSPGFEQIEFIETVGNAASEYTAKITFGSHSMDGFGIRHRSHDTANDDVLMCEAPASTGAVRVNFMNDLASQDAVYPNLKFKLFAYDGVFAGCGRAGTALDVRGSASFTLPEAVAPASAFQDG